MTVSVSRIAHVALSTASPRRSGRVPPVTGNVGNMMLRSPHASFQQLCFDLGQALLEERPLDLVIYDGQRVSVGLGGLVDAA